jgi:tRNA acetyltransferase TAN1
LKFYLYLCFSKFSFEEFNAPRKRYKVGILHKNFNLLVSCPRFHEKDAIAEIWYLYSNIGDNEVKAEQTIFPGLITAKTQLNPLESIRNLRDLIKTDPLILKFVLKIMPIETIVDTTQENINKVASDLGSRILPNETFRITAKSRFSRINPQELILEVAHFIDRKVNLTAPNKILLIQILGTITGLSLIEPDNILTKTEFLE